MSPPEQPTTDEPTDTVGGHEVVPAKAASSTTTQPKHVDSELLSSHGGPLTATTTTRKAGHRRQEFTAEDLIVSSQPIIAQSAAETTRNDVAAALGKKRDTVTAMTSPPAAALSHGLPHPLTSAPAHYLAAEPSGYVDPTPATPITSQPSSRSPSNARRSRAHSPTRSDDGDKSLVSDDEPDGGSRSEIQSIMEQFSEAGGGPGEDEVMSPRLEIASPLMSGSLQLPTQRSSLEPATSSLSSQLHELNSNSLRPSTASPASVRSRDRLVEDQGPPVPPKDAVFAPPARPKCDRAPSSMTSPLSPVLPVHLPPPPEPELEPALPFDFHRFLEQLRNKKADPVARYLKSFLFEFGRRQWMVHEQVKIIGDFLAFIANKMAQCEVWRDVSDAEFNNAREGMEKLVMNRLYTQTFSPAIAPPKPIPGAKPKRRGDDVPMGPGRRGQHQEDVERDDILTQRINIYGWIKEEHLDISLLGDTGRRFLKLAQQELLKIKSYRAPRDKIICVLNCSKVIFGLLKHNRSDASADSFMPLLIYVVLQSNPEHLVSNVQYILRFRNQEKLAGEAGYYLSSLMGAVQFVESMDRSSLTISDDEFERNVEAAVSVIAEKHSLTSPVISQQAAFGSEKRPSMDVGLSTPPPRPLSSASNDSESRDEAPSIAGLLRSIQKPLSSIGRIFTDEAGPSSPASSPAPAELSSRASSDLVTSPTAARLLSTSKHGLSAEEAAARQASAETAEALRLQRAEHANVVETLAGMFPDLDRDLISDVVYQKQGRVGLAVDACLALSA